MAGDGRNEMRASVLELVSGGVKGVELACEMAVRHPSAGDGILRLLEEMVRVGEIVEVEYVTPENRCGDEARVKSFYLPAGTQVRLAPMRAAAA